MKTKTWKIILTLLVISATLAFIVSMLMTGSDTISKSKTASLTMIQNLSSTKESATACWNEQKVLGTNCKLLKESLPKSGQDNYYFSSDQGALIGVDFASRVVVVLTPIIDGVNLKWHCAVTPSGAIPKSCDAL